MSSVVIGIVLGMGFFGIIKLVLWVVLVDCVLVGLLISTIYWFVVRRDSIEFKKLKFILGMSLIDIYLPIQNQISMLNGHIALMFISMLYYLYSRFYMLVNYLFSIVNSRKILEIHLSSSFIAFAVTTSYLYCLVGNTVWVIAVGYYIYILFLGFSGRKK